MPGPIVSTGEYLQLVSQVTPANTGGIGDVGSIPGSERYPGGGNARCSSILAWRIPRTEAGYSPWDHRESDTTEHTYFIYI